MSHELTWLLVAVPAVSAAILLLGGKATNAWGHLLGTLAPLISFAFGVVCSSRCRASPSDDRAERSAVRVVLGRRAQGGLQPADRPAVDPVRAADHRCGFLIHIYSIGYMEHDERRRRFFGYLNLFVAAMLLLVLAARLPGGVRRLGGRRPGVVPADRVLAAQDRPRRPRKKAFVVNRVGDIGLSLAVMSMLALFGTSAFATVNAVSTNCPPGHAARADAAARRPAASPRRCRCSPGCWTRWRARPRCRPSSTRRPWSPRASTWWSARARSTSDRRRATAVVIVGTVTAAGRLRSSVAPRTTSRRRWPVRR